ncbi:endonuclease/exonuclease/phosphatase family protein [Flavobacteriaceae bacterium 14752]|uniref:endonuclease/exonuclease/phosphatase family protein n=1 Tax=Mesohalobacter salilacus TaxID=2491711 RepID=UPI000F6353E7|nr:endonuclease/exonuclease/phosphatase family protein [Flavobacteriaceae bacterium 14752]
MIVEIFLIVFLLFSTLHYWPSQHWVFRNVAFAKIQLSVIQFIVIIILVAQFSYLSDISKMLSVLIVLTWLHNLFILLPYTPIYPKESRKLKTSKQVISFLSVNVYQYNQKYHLLIDLIKRLQPDILLTMESDKHWEKALEDVEDLFQYAKKVPQDNTYGIHFYSKLKAKSIQVNYFVADDLPSIEANLISKNGDEFMFFGVHPPPPSPTEEETSKERDADILALGKRIKKLNKPCLVIGDFNNVAWSKSSKLFKKMTQLFDPRIGRGFISTFHAKYLFFRFPIDLIFHSKSIYVQKLKTEKHINSDHFPLYGEFVIDHKAEEQLTEIEKPSNGEKESIDDMIKEGKAVESENR